MADRTSAVVVSGMLLLAAAGIVTVFAEPIRGILAPPPSPAESGARLAPAPALLPVEPRAAATDDQPLTTVKRTE